VGALPGLAQAVKVGHKIQFCYQLAWSSPIKLMKEWHLELIAAALQQAKPFL